MFYVIVSIYSNKIFSTTTMPVVIVFSLLQTGMQAVIVICPPSEGLRKKRMKGLRGIGRRTH